MIDNRTSYVEMPARMPKLHCCPLVSRKRDANIGGGRHIDDPRIGLEDESILCMAIPTDPT